MEGEHLNSILWTGGQFVAVGMGATCFSQDGREWERRPNKNAPLAAAFGIGAFVGQVLKSEHHFEVVAWAG